ncbi:MAG: NADH-quinone oxidoreductase subunit L, partial [Gammaproteobacteria bacterium]
DFLGPWAMMKHAFVTWPFWLAVGGIAAAFVFYILLPGVPAWAARRFALLYEILVHKYGFDEFNNWFFVRGGQKLATWLFQEGDVKILDDVMVNGSGRVIAWLSATARKLQSGYLYHYALAMVLGVLVFLGWFLIN